MSQVIKNQIEKLEKLQDRLFESTSKEDLRIALVITDKILELSKALKEITLAQALKEIALAEPVQEKKSINRN